MLRVKKRFFHGFYRHRAPEDRLICEATPVAIENPITGELEEHLVMTFAQPKPIDPSLRCSDFSLEVQLRNGVQLQDCQKYLKPSTPEEYGAMLSDVIGKIYESAEKENQRIEVKQSPQVQEPANVEPSKTTE